MSQINSECLFFDDTDDETEVNSLLSGFLIDAALVIQASTPTIQKYQRSYMPRDRYGAHRPTSASICLLTALSFQEWCECCLKSRHHLALVKWYIRDSPTAYTLLFPEFSKSEIYYNQKWAVLMKSISQPGSNDVKRIRYKQAHEAARKDEDQSDWRAKKK
ncbi:hypothetical protein Tco_0375544 [Tanacetum coccineum]